MSELDAQEQQKSAADETPRIVFPAIGEKWERNSMRFIAVFDNRHVVFAVPQEVFMDHFGGRLIWTTKEQLVTACQEAFHENIDMFHEVACEKITAGLADGCSEITLAADDF